MDNYDGISAKCGSMLGEKYWVPVLNDIWLVAGCHRLLPFYLGALRPVVWSEAKDRPSHLGREIIGLLACGYAMVGAPHRDQTGIVFVPRDRDRAQRATLVQIGTAARKVKSDDAIKKLIRAALTVPADNAPTRDEKRLSATDLKGKVARVVHPIVGYNALLNVGGPLQYTILPGRIRFTGDVGRLDSSPRPQDFIGVSILGRGAPEPAVAIKSFHGHPTEQVWSPLEVMYVAARIILSSPNVIVE